MKEEWKPIKGYEGLYELRNDGLIHCLPRKYTKERYTFGNELPKKGYLTFLLSGNGKRENKRMHRLVWETFVGPIPKGYDVHHINHNCQDNRLENLCLIEHNKHSEMHFEDKKECFNNSRVERLSKSVIQFKLDGSFVAEYPSARDAERKTKINHSHISKCCLHKSNSAGGFIWKYKDAA